MKGVWKCSLGLALGLLLGRAAAQEVQWRPTPSQPVAVAPVPRPPAATLGKPVPLATLEKPVPLNTAPARPIVDPQVQPASLLGVGGFGAPAVARGQAVEVGPRPMPVGPAPAVEGDVLKVPSKFPPPPTPMPGPDVPLAPAVPTGPGAEPGGPMVIEGDACYGADGDPTCCVEADGVCGEDGCCQGLGNRWYFNAEYLMWWIKRSNVPTLVRMSPSTAAGAGSLNDPFATTLFGGGEVGHDLRSGGKFTVGYWFNDEQSCGLEGIFFFIGQRNVHFGTTSMGTPGLFRPFFRANGLTDDEGNFLLPGEDAEEVAVAGRLAGTVTVDMTSRLWGSEINFRHLCHCGPCCRTDWVCGFRMLGLDETLRVHESLTQLTDPGGTIQLTDLFATENRFYGWNFGGLTQLRRGPWTLDLRYKMALGGTHQIVNVSGTTLTNEPGSAPRLSQGGLLAQGTNIGRYSRDRFAVVPDLGITVGYNLTDSLRLYAGYNFLYWSSVARPEQQIDRVVNTTQLPPGVLRGTPRPLFAFRSTDFIAHGVNFGLEYKY